MSETTSAADNSADQLALLSPELSPQRPLLLVGAGKMGGAMLAGWIAGGLNAALHHPLDPLGIKLAVTTSAGVALFLLGQAASLRALGIGPVQPHVVTALLALVACAAGVVGPAVALLALLALLLMGLSWWLSR